MIKKFATLAFGLLASYASAATAVVWTNEDGVKVDKAPAYSFTFKYGTGAAIDTTNVNGAVVIDFTAKAGKTSNGAGYGIGWEQTCNADYSSCKDTPISLSAYKGVCMTYKAEMPFRVDFKQSTITDDNYYGMEIPAATGFRKTFIAFSELTQGWKSTTTVAWNATKQTGVQIGFKNTHATVDAGTNEVQIASFILADECVTHAPELVAPYTSGEGSETLNEGDTLKLDMSKMFTDEDGDDLKITVKIVNDGVKAVALAGTDTVFNQNSVIKLVTTPNPKNGAVVSITATDPTKKTASYTLTVDAIDRENAPVAVNDSYETDEEVALKVAVKNSVLANDYDADGDEFVIGTVGDVEHGVLAFDTDLGTFTYTPEKDFYGEDSFTYTVVEVGGTKESAPATVTIKVNNVDDPAVVEVVDPAITVGGEAAAIGDTIPLLEDFEEIAIKIPTAGVVFSDPDGEANLTIGAKLKGDKVVTLDYVKLASSYVIQVAPVADASGLAEVILYAAEGKDTVSVSVFLNVVPVKDNPVAVADAYKVIQDSLNVIDAKKGVLANDYNPDGASVLGAAVVDDVKHGTLEFKVDGSFTYESEAGYEGEDSFTYYNANAVGDASDTVEVILTVLYKNHAPEIVAEILDTLGNSLSALTEDFTTIKKFAKLDVLSWFVDDSDKAADLKITVRSDDSLLAPSMSSGAILVKSVRNACGEAKVIVTATDTQGASTDLEIPAVIACTNDKPVALNDTIYVGTEDWSLDVDLYDVIMDPDGDTLTFEVSATKNADEALEWTVKDNMISIVPKADAILLENYIMAFSVKGTDATTYATAKLILIVGDDPRDTTNAIRPVVASPKMGWQQAIMANRGAAVMMDVQGRVMWKRRLPVSADEVRAAADSFQGRKVLRVNNQTFTIK
ncbi:MAG: cadherin-like domain-containing protein [Fibrobacter sp.]|nr:cadherin-like domain-containing protein [Fibrobacter sp.]